MPGSNGDCEPYTAPKLRGDERTAKILVAGHLAAGKTTLVGAVSDITPLRTEEEMTSAGTGTDHTLLRDKTTTTVAMDFGRISLDDDLVLYVFGAPGQPRFFPFLTDLAYGALGALVLLDDRCLAETYPIVDMIENLGLPYVVAVNAFDGSLGTTLERLREVMLLEPGTPILRCDARDPHSATNALVTLTQHVLTPDPEPSR
ncbi:ATP/GTP-binding protein [Streptomyces sp. NBC_00838]|uniref:GTP-binding protein n=1 Tax=Streptomyces sp. NBC_00838 TaxID=2903680 RepID=UPI003868CE02|nr:ATP/GTP-binding protein [Streptomyces sp. NBC_00838]